MKPTLQVGLAPDLTIWHITVSLQGTVLLAAQPVQAEAEQGAVVAMFNVRSHTSRPFREVIEEEFWVEETSNIWGFKLVRNQTGFAGIMAYVKAIVPASA